jgi:succinate dehydrogenase / fumarate reductase cytochrome b subunit
MPASPTSKPARPLSPHLQVYKPQLTSMLSIMHRATGVGLSVGLLVLSAWIFSVALGHEAFEGFNDLFKNPIGHVLLLAWTWAFFYHFCTGIRHLFWDAGYFLSIRNVYITGWIAVAVSVLITGAIWLDIENNDWQAFGILVGQFLAAVIVLGILAFIGLFIMGLLPNAPKKDNSMRTDLAKVRGLGSAKEGTTHWLGLRITAAALILLSLNLLWTFFYGKVYGDFSSMGFWISSPISAILMIMFFGVGYHHAANGVQEVIEDYVHNEKLKVVSILTIKFLAVAFAVLVIVTILKILFFVNFAMMMQNAQQQPPQQ